MGDRVGVPWLGWTCGDVCVLPLRAREPVRAGALHRLSDRRRLRRVHRRRPALLLRHPRRLQRHRGGAAAVRRPDRLSLAAHGGRGAAARHLRLRRRGAHHRAGGALAGPGGLRLHQPRRHRGAGIRPRAWRRMGGRLGPAPPEPLDAAIIFAPVGPLVPAALRAVAARRHGGVRRHPHEPDIPAFPTTSCGASASCAPSPI